MTPIPAEATRGTRVAFTNMAYAEWPAGIQYQENLFIAVKLAAATRPLELALLTTDGTDPHSYALYEDYMSEVLTVPFEAPEPQVWPNFWQRQASRVTRRLQLVRPPPAREPALARYLRRHQIDAVFAVYTMADLPYGRPLLAWIPDFQHLRLPEMFSAEEIELRNAQIRHVAQSADRVILSSQQVRGEFERLAPASLPKARVLSFVAHVPNEVYAIDPRWICEQYHLPQRFVFLPNQFWKHKNHQLVLEAMTKLRGQPAEMAIVCTGQTFDHRHPSHFGELLAGISRHNLRERVIVLGIVPHAHVFQLMRAAVAVLQPSLSEGWSTSVEEAKALGKQLILSDIAVHREQAPQADFFDPSDAASLAECLARVCAERPAGPDASAEAVARAQTARRALAFGQTFIDIVLESVAP